MLCCPPFPNPSDSGLRLTWVGSRQPCCGAGGWQPPSLHPTCLGLPGGTPRSVNLLLWWGDSPIATVSPPVDSVLSLWGTSGLHHRSLTCRAPAAPVCRVGAGAVWLPPSVPFTCLAPPASDGSHAVPTLWLCTRTPEQAWCSCGTSARHLQPPDGWLSGLQQCLAGTRLALCL